MSEQRSNEEAYFKGKTVQGQLEYIRRTWGVEVSVSLDLLTPGQAGAAYLVTVQVPHLVHKLELLNPPATVVSGTGRRLPALQDIIGDALWLWMCDVKAHLDASSS